MFLSRGEAFLERELRSGGGGQSLESLAEEGWLSLGTRKQEAGDEGWGFWRWVVVGATLVPGIPHVGHGEYTEEWGEQADTMLGCDLTSRPTDPEDAGPVSWLWIYPDHPGPPSPPMAAPSSLHHGSSLCRLRPNYDLCLLCCGAV